MQLLFAPAGSLKSVQWSVSPAYLPPNPEDRHRGSLIPSTIESPQCASR
ncbi:hypothetical protein Pla52n_55710 [Stieleria varia]|uniref:Uncharacterized protein n=1 Tax=Stieleria varia TaxID=2528005 RepID=A0A5C6A5X9_9BACT|nr:hypothetical protein Pla52n_55710 [Stieleria varia]